MENIKIPLTLFKQIIDLLECLTQADFEPAIRADFDNVYYTLLKKRHSLELRKAYSKIIFAKDDDARIDARIDYLRQKRDIDNFF